MKRRILSVLAAFAFTYLMFWFLIVPIRDARAQVVIVDGESTSGTLAAAAYQAATNALYWATNAVSPFGIYPEFEIPVGDANGRWTDYEIKASTNGFTNLVYHFQSFAAPDASYGDTNALVWFTDDFLADPRRWVAKAADTAIALQLTSATGSVVRVVYHSASRTTKVPAAGWMSATNTRLVWMFSRWDGATSEKNAGGTVQQWTLIEPKWKHVRKSP
jgi:hypothetical protein